MNPENQAHTTNETHVTVSGSLPAPATQPLALSKDFPVLENWLKSLSPAQLAGRAREEIQALSETVGRSGRDPVELFKQLNILVSFGLKPSALFALKNLFSEAITNGYSPVGTLSYLSSYLPQKKVNSSAQIDGYTIEIIRLAVAERDFASLPGKLNTIARVYFLSMEPTFIEAVTQTLSVKVPENETVHQKNNWLSSMLDCIRHIASASPEVQQQSAAILKNTAACQGSPSNAIYFLRTILYSAPQPPSDAYPEKLALLTKLAKTAVVGKGILPGITPLLGWAIETITVLSNLEGQRNGSHSLEWRLNEMKTVSGQLARLTQMASQDNFPVESLPAYIVAQKPQFLTYPQIELARALTPPITPLTHPNRLDDEIRATLFYTVTRLTNAPQAEQELLKVIKFAEALAQNPNPSVEAVQTFCKALEYQSIKPQFPVLAKLIDERTASHPDEAQKLIERVYDVFLSRGDYPRRIFSAKARDAIEAFAEYEISHGLTPQEFLGDIRHFSGHFAQDEPWSEVLKLVELCKERKLTLRGLSVNFVVHASGITETEWPQVFRLMSAAQRFHKEQNFSSDQALALYQSVQKAVVDFIRMKASPRAYRAVERILRQDATLGRTIELIEREAKVYAAALKRIELSSLPPTAPEQSEVVEALISIERAAIKNDGFPVRDLQRDEQDTAIAKRIQRETLNTFALSYDVFHGFSAQRFSCQRVLAETPLTVQCAEECGANITELREGSEDVYPGTGFRITDLDPALMFQSSSLSRKQSKLNSRVFPYIQESLGYLSETELTLMRGFIAITPPDIERFRIDDVHYSYMVFNEHFGKFNIHPSILVPTATFRTAFDERLILGPEAPSPLSFEKLINRAGKYGPYTLDLCSGSNLSTGLQNSFPPYSVPHFTWENSVPGYSTKDTFGHVHKAYHLRELTRNEAQGVLKDLQELHDSVRRVFLHSHRLLQSFQVIQSGWSRGYGGKQSPHAVQEAVNYSQLFDAGLPPEWSSVLAAPNARMLQSAFHYYRAGQEGWDESSIPVLATCDAERYSQPPHQQILDPLTLTLILGDTPISITDLNAARLTKTWEKVLQSVNEEEKVRQRFQELRWVQRSYFNKE